MSGLWIFLFEKTVHILRTLAGQQFCVFTYLQRFVDERDQIRPPVGYGRIFDEVKEMRIPYFLYEHAIRVNDALTVLVIGPVDLVDFFHVHFARVPRQHFPVVVDYTLQCVFGGAQ